MTGFKETVRKPVFIVGVVLVIALIVALSIVLANIKSFRNRNQPSTQSSSSSFTFSPFKSITNDDNKNSIGGKKADIKGGSRKLILISIDGMRYDMLSDELTPHLMAIGRNGSIAPLEPQFPSVTFPNHYSLLTGLLPGEHGIIGNRFMNSRTGKHFSVNEGTFKDPKWWQIDPLWSQVNSSVCMWPASDVAINGKRPNRWMPYQGDMKPIARMDTLLDWIQIDAKNITVSSKLYISYLSAFDEASHESGPDSPAAQNALKRIDSAIGHLWNGLQVRNLTDSIDLMLVSDHGFTSVPRFNRISMHKLLPGYTSHLRFWECGAVTHVIPHAQDIPTVLSRLRKLAGQGAPYRVYTKDNIPNRWHLKTRRTQYTLPPILLVAKAGHAIDCIDFQKRNDTSISEQQDIKPNDIIGIHGYDVREEPDMMAALIATGPHFKKMRAEDSFSNLDIYNLAARILQIKPAANNGTMRLAEAILQ